MDAWIPPSKGSPLGRTVRRISLTLTCGVRPFNRTKNVYDVGISRDGREKRVLGLLNVKPAEVHGWVRYALGTLAYIPLNLIAISLEGRYGFFDGITPWQLGLAIAASTLVLLLLLRLPHARTTAAAW